MINYCTRHLQGHRYANFARIFYVSKSWLHKISFGILYWRTTIFICWIFLLHILIWCLLVSTVVNSVVDAWQIKDVVVGGSTGANDAITLIVLYFPTIDMVLRKDKFNFSLFFFLYKKCIWWKFWFCDNQKVYRSVYMIHLRQPKQNYGSPQIL